MLQHQRFGQQPRHARVAAELAAAEQFHGQPERALVLAGREHGDDVGVRQAFGGLGFGKKASACFVVFFRGELVPQRQALHGHVPARGRVLRQVHHTHRAAAERAQQAEGAQHGRVGDAHSVSCPRESTLRPRGKLMVDRPVNWRSTGGATTWRKP